MFDDRSYTQPHNLSSEQVNMAVNHIQSRASTDNSRAHRAHGKQVKNLHKQQPTSW